MYVEVDATADLSEADARQRAAIRYGTPGLVAALDNTPKQSEEWPLLRAHRAKVVTSELPFDGEAPPDTAGKAYHAVTVDRDAVGRDGWRQRLPTVTIFCTLTPASDGWRVDRIELNVGGTP
jgi:hypothetical protein